MNNQYIGNYLLIDFEKDFSLKNYNEIILIADLIEMNKNYLQYDQMDYFSNLIAHKANFFSPKSKKVNENFLRASREDIELYLMNLKKDLDTITSYLRKYSVFMPYQFKITLKYYLYYNQFAIINLHFYNPNEWRDSYYINYNQAIQKFVEKNMKTMVMDYADIFDDVIEDYHCKNDHKIMGVYNYNPNKFEKFLRENEDKMKRTQNNASTILENILKQD